jgi:hypothetical protein
MPIMAPVRCTAQPSCRMDIPLSTLPQISNNIIQKGLAFVRKQSGSVTVPDTGVPRDPAPPADMARLIIRCRGVRTRNQTEGWL